MGTPSGPANLIYASVSCLNTLSGCNLVLEQRIPEHQVGLLLAENGTPDFLARVL